MIIEKARIYRLQNIDSSFGYDFESVDQVTRQTRNNSLDFKSDQISNKIVVNSCLTQLGQLWNSYIVKSDDECWHLVKAYQYFYRHSQTLRQNTQQAYVNFH